MSTVQDWRVRKSVGLGWVSAECANGADAAYEMLMAVQKRDAILSRFGSRPSIQDWLALYRRGNSVLYGLAARFLALRTSTEYARNTITQLRTLLRDLCNPDWHGTTVGDLLRILPCIPECMQGCLDAWRDYEAWFVGWDNFLEEEGRADEVASVMQTAEMQFLIRVWFPCYVFYGDYAPRLYRRARQGDMDALEKLLRLDKYLQQDPRINKQLAEAAEQCGGRWKRLCRALNANCPKISRSKVKQRLTAWLSEIWRRLNVPLTDVDFEGLWDSVARDSGKQTGDPDIPAGETWSKQIQRGRTGWHIFRPTGQKKCRNCPGADSGASVKFGHESRSTKPY